MNANKQTGTIWKCAEYYQSKEHKQMQAEHAIRMEKKMLVERLNKSMGTQTEALPKPSYKDLTKQPFLARITAQLEKNDHDNYCSDDDCEYTKTVIKTNIIVPEKYVGQPVGKIMDIKCYKWANHLPVPEVTVNGSGYCKFHKPKRGVGQHKYRYTIKKVEIVENKKYVKNYHYEAKTVTVGQMMKALSVLPPDAKLVMTEEGFYSQSDFAEVMLPEPYMVKECDERCNNYGLPPGTKVYRIGHSSQRY
jgi:hypothetical protein